MGGNVKYTIFGFSQARLIELGLSIEDAAILRWFVDFAHSKKMLAVEVDGRAYYWVNYKYVGEQLPIISGSSAERIRKRFARYCELGLFDRVTRSNNEKRGSRTFYAASDLFEELYSEYSDQRSETTGGHDRRSNPTSGKGDQRSNLTPGKGRPEVKSDLPYSSINKNSSIKEDSSISDPSPPAPADLKTRWYNAIRDWSFARYGEWEPPLYGKEGSAIKRLQEYSEKRFPDDPIGFSKEVLETFERLKRDDPFFEKFPSLPSNVVSKGIWPQVLEAMRTKEVKRKSGKYELTPDDVREIVEGLGAGKRRGISEEEKARILAK